MAETETQSLIGSALEQLELLLQYRFDLHFNAKSEEFQWENVLQSDLNGFYHRLNEVLKVTLSIEEYITLLVGMAPHFMPSFFDSIIENQIKDAGDFPILGGLRGKNYRGFLPTGETVLFLLAGQNINKRLFMEDLFDQDHFFYKQRIIWLETPPLGEPQMSGKLIFSQEHLDLIVKDKAFKPQFGINFPAQRLETFQTWDDLVLNEGTLNQINEIKKWLEYGDILLKDMEMYKKLKPGYRAMFYGPPGTGKTLTASLLGKYFDKDVYKIDLSLIISKYIGETEKNLATLFDKAENRDWILFFDEADALFGKRTNVKDAHDRYANQEVSYLLQRTENYNGLVILATNIKGNIDDAFVRRFQAIIPFPLPNAKERLLIWQKAFPTDMELESKVEIKDIAKKYKLSGSNIMNIVQYSSIEALARKSTRVSLESIVKGIKREFEKEGRLLGK